MPKSFILLVIFCERLLFSGVECPTDRLEKLFLEVSGDDGLCMKMNKLGEARQKNSFVYLYSDFNYVSFLVTVEAEIQQLDQKHVPSQ